ncbi:helix-turn-helix domain-containing protein [Staphylococcus arlettae]|uniref:helix-turn-helix domain-containing protein n=1 Tax=Staphylococcus arlettae TaxID=29378 RepID=UPI003BA38E93
MYDKKSVGERIKSIRINNGKTQEQFGELFSASKGNVATWEKGLSLPNKERLKLISELGNITIDELLYGTEFTKESISNYVLNNPEGFKSNLNSAISNFVSSYLDDSKDLLRNLDSGRVFYFKKLFDRLIITEKASNSINDEIEQDNYRTQLIIKKIVNSIFEDLLGSVHLNLNKEYYFSTYLFYMEILLNEDFEYYDEFFKYLIEKTEQIGRNIPSILKFMLHQYMNNVFSKINVTLLDEESASITDRITDSNGLYINKNILIDSIDYEEYEKIINKINEIHHIIDSISE